jgi:hypothetical protein
MYRFNLNTHAGVLLLLASACTNFGYARERSADPSRALVTNAGENRYVFSVTRIRRLRAKTERATPLVNVAPGNLAEVIVINVKAEFTGYGSEGLRSTEADFYSDLATLAAEYGATRFHVASKTVTGVYVSTMTVSGLAPESTEEQ